MWAIQIISKKENKRIGKFSYPFKILTIDGIFLLCYHYSKWFVCCVDLGHSAVSGIEPQYLVRGMKGGLLKALHVHDNDYELDRHWLPFMGRFNWDEIGKALKEVNYDGDLTLEICPLFNNFDEENIQGLLNFVEKVGRQVIKRCM